MENFVSKFGAAFDARKFTAEEFINNPNLQNHIDGLYYRITHGYEDAGRERILQYVNAEDFYQELFSACAEGDLYETVVNSKDMTNATKEFVNFVENSEFLSMDARRMFIDGFKSSVEAEYLRAFEEEKEMLENLNLKNFPKDGTVELATDKLVKAIVENKLDEKEIDYLSTKFRYNFAQKEKYGKATKLSLENYSKETIKEGIAKGLANDTDFLLDMQYSGQLVPVPNEIYTNDRDTLVTRDVDRIYKELLNGESAKYYGFLFDGYEAEDFYCDGLLKDLYDSDKCTKLREAEADVCEVTDEILKIIKNEEPAKKDELLQEFHDRLEGAYDSYLDCGDEMDLLVEANQEKATEILKAKGFLNDAETYLMLGTNIDWLGNIGICLKKVEELEDMIKGVVPKGDYTIDITKKENVPYFEAMVYSHDVPTGSHCYFLPESQWGALIGYDKETKTFNQGYKFIEDFIKKEYRASRECANKSFAPPLHYGERLKEIFNARKKEIEMDLEAKKNPIVAEIKEVYDQYISDNYGSDTQEKFEDNGVFKAWDEVCEHLAEKLESESKNFKEFAEYEELLTKFNPTTSSSETVSNTFKDAFNSELKYHYDFCIENVDSVTNGLEKGYDYLNYANRDLSVSEIEKQFMRDIIEKHGTNYETIKQAIDVVSEHDNLLPHESAKLLNNTLTSKEYQQAFEKGQGKTTKNVKQF